MERELSKLLTFVAHEHYKEVIVFLKKNNNFDNLLVYQQLIFRLISVGISCTSMA